MSNIQETSIEAFEGIIGTLGERQREVYDVIKELGYCTNTMIANNLKLPISSITPRNGELRKKNLVEESHRSWCPITKRKCIYWKIK